MSQIVQRIEPAPAFAEPCNAFVVGAAQNIPPTFTVAVGCLTAGTPGTPEKGTPGHAGYVAAVAAVADKFDVQKTVQVQMTLEEWNAWTSQDDAAYIASIVAARLGFKPAP